MSEKILFADAVDYIRTINDNMVDNALGARSSYTLLPTLYQRAYLLSRQTGQVPVTENVVAPDEAASIERDNEVNIVTSDE